MAVKRKYRLNLRNYGNLPAIMLSQYDEGYALEFEIRDGTDAASDLSAYTVTLKGTRADTLAYSFAGTVSTNVLTFVIDTTMTACAGRGTAEIAIKDTANDVLFATFNMPVFVERAAVPEGSIDADVERAQEIAEQVQEIVDNAAAAVSGEAEKWATGQIDGTDVPSTDPAYENNAKYYAEQAETAAASIGIDATLTQAGKAADAKKTGDEISTLKEDLSNRINIALDGVSVDYYQTSASGTIVEVLDVPVPAGMGMSITNDSDDTTFVIILIDEDRGVHNLGYSVPGYTRTTTQTKPIVEVRYAITDGSTLDSTVTYGEGVVPIIEDMEDTVISTEIGLQALESTVSLTFQKSSASGLIVNVLDATIPTGTDLSITNDDTDTSFYIILIGEDRTSYALGLSPAGYTREYTTLAPIVEIRYSISSGSTLDSTVTYGDNLVERVNDLEAEQNGTLKTRTTAVLGYEVPDDISDYSGVTSAYATAMRSAVTAWMSEYAGNDEKIPFIVHTDQHGRLTTAKKGIFQLLNYIVNWDEISAIFNLGDTINDHWEDDDTNTDPLLRNGELENALDCVQPIPLDKQINVYGNHDTWYQNGTVSTGVSGTLPSKCYLNPYFKTRGLRTVKCPDNSGLMVVYDDRFKVKYLVCASWDYADAPSADQSYLHYFANADHWAWMIEQMATDEGYNLVIVSHLPLITRSGSAFDPITQEAITGTTYYFASNDTDSPLVFSARKDKTAGSITINGETIPYDFTNCKDDFLCAISGHTHMDMVDRAGGTLLVTAFDWFDKDTIHFGLFDAESRKLIVWKLSNDNDTPAVQKWEAPFELT